MKQSLIEFKTKLPNPRTTFNEASLLIYDNYFDNKQQHLKPIQSWIKKFPHRISFASGESLKDLKTFPEKIKLILEAVDRMAVKNVQIIGLGGGSIGDFTGFVASILKRGLPLVHIPTTWLSAIDSAHGGKTALNVAGFKNQIGTFYPADKIVLIKPILLQQPESRSQEAFGEALKMALLTGGSLWQKFSKIKNFNNQVAWNFLPELIHGKYKIVKKDPYEKLGYRHLLNLGHTLGHAWEVTAQLPHGTAVAYGLRASLEISRQKNIISSKTYKNLISTPAMQLLPTLSQLQQVTKKTKHVETYLAKDKKISQKKSLRFIFIKAPGKCPIEDIQIEQLTQFHKKLQLGQIS